MEVKNDFPKSDRVLRNLKYLTNYLKNIKKTSKDEKELKRAENTLGFVNDYINGIANYLDNVCNTPDRIRRLREENVDTETIQYFIENEDQKRTNYHNSIITNMCFIDRMATIFGQEKPFDYAEEFTNDFSRLTAVDENDKKNMSERARIKRREMGNFGLYIAASITAGLEMDDREVRKFASCETDNIEVNPVTYKKIVEKSHKVKGNMNQVIE